MASTWFYVGWGLTTNYFALAVVEAGLAKKSESLISNFHVDPDLWPLPAFLCLTPPLLTLKLWHKSNKMMFSVTEQHKLKLAVSVG